MIVFDKEYDSESLNDLGRDVQEAFDPAYNAAIGSIATDEHGFAAGSFRVVIYYQDDEEDGK